MLGKQRLLLYFYSFLLENHSEIIKQDICEKNFVCMKNFSVESYEDFFE